MEIQVNCQVNGELGVLFITLNKNSLESFIWL